MAKLVGKPFDKSPQDTDKVGVRFANLRSIFYLVGGGVMLGLAVAIAEHCAKRFFRGGRSQPSVEETHKENILSPDQGEARVL